MEVEQRKKIESQIRALYEKREMFLGAGDVEKFNGITAEIAKLEKKIREE